MTPVEMVKRLLTYYLPRCHICSGPATRKADIIVIIGDSPVFCDEHDLTHVRDRRFTATTYTDLGDAALIRTCNAYLRKVG